MAVLPGMLCGIWDDVEHGRAGRMNIVAHSYVMLSRDFIPSFDLSRAARIRMQRHPRNLKICGKLTRNPAA